MGFQEESSLSTDLSLNIHGPVITSSSITKPQAFFLDHERKTTMGFQGESVSTDLSLNILGPVMTSSITNTKQQPFFLDDLNVPFKTTMGFQGEYTVSTALSLNIHGPVITSSSITKPQAFFLDHERKTTMGFQGESVSTDLSLNILGPVMTSSITNTKQQPFFLDDLNVPFKTTMGFQGESTVSTALSLNIHGPVIISSTTKQTFVLDDRNLPFEKRSMPQVDLVEKTKRIFEEKEEDHYFQLVEELFKMKEKDFTLKDGSSTENAIKIVRPLSIKSDEEKEKKKRKITKKMERGSVVSNEVPEKLEQFIKGEMINGVDIKLVIEKSLFASDLNPSQNRLNMPIKQLVTPDFLKADEKQFLEMHKENTIEVQLVGPTLQMYNKPMRLKRWKQRCTYNYVLITNWNHFVAANKEILKEGSIIQVWSFRRNQQLCFAIVVVGSPDDMNSDA